MIESEGMGVGRGDCSSSAMLKEFGEDDGEGKRVHTKGHEVISHDSDLSLSTANC